MSGHVSGPLTDVSRETMDRLRDYEAMVRRWTKRINLVSANTLDDFRTRHVLDSAQLLRLAPGFDTWVDIGSGAGLPGLVIAILVADRSPPPQVTLIESDSRKATFLQAVRRDLNLECEIIAERAEKVAPLGADLVSARAVASLTDLLPLAARHLGPGGQCLFPKGSKVSQEIATAREHWRFDLTEIPSITSATARILKIEFPVRA